ncbi:MAG TPA: hypothetical protein VL882_27075 [Vicinamibacterales bacterium]|nr:hypothetical protein [Vicinamibacterales bacterium]
MIRYIFAPIFVAVLLQAPQASSPDAEGFIRNWLVLAPIAVQEDSGATEIEKDFLGGEATIRPKPGDKVNAGGKILTWTPHQASDYFVDFLKAFGTERGEDVAGYAVAYISADDSMNVRLSVGSNDQCKVWVNGKQVIKFSETRTLDKDTDSADVVLNKGQNVLVFKVINEKNNWQAAARFLQNGAPVKNIRIATTPQ